MCLICFYHYLWCSAVVFIFSQGLIISLEWSPPIYNFELNTILRKIKLSSRIEVVFVDIFKNPEIDLEEAFLDPTHTGIRAKRLIHLI